MSCKPSSQCLRIEAQILASLDNNVSLVRALFAVLDPNNEERYEFNRQEPEKNTLAREGLLSDLRIISRRPRMQSDNSHTLPRTDEDITVDDYLQRIQEAQENGHIAHFRPLGEFLIAQLNDGSFLVQKTNLILEKPIAPMLVVFDETQYWKEDAPQVKQAGKIFATYFVDTSTVTHLCEITPSYELIHLYTTPENDDEEGRIHSWIVEHNNPASELDTYQHAARIERLSDANKYYDQRHYLEADQSYEEALESLLEHLRGNPELQTPTKRSLAPSM